MPGIDYSNAPEQGGRGAEIPDGSFVFLRMSIKHGGHSMGSSGDMFQDQADAALFSASSRSDAYGLDCKFVVEGGPNAGRELTEWQTVSGGKLNDKGESTGWNMTKTRHRAMIDSACGLDPKDKSPQAAETRKIPSFASLDGIGFYAKIAIEEGQEIVQDGQKTGRYYQPKNVIERVIVPGDTEYADLKAGKEVPPKPRTVAHVSASGPSQAAAAPPKTAWGGGAAAGPGGGAPQPQPASAVAPAATAAPPPGSPAPAAGQRPAWLNR